MSVSNLKQVNLILICITTIMYLIGMQYIPDMSTGKEVTFFDAFIVSIIIAGLNLILWSDWMYYNELIDKGAKIKYETYQKIVLGIIILFMCVICNSIYNALYDGEIGIKSLLVEAVLLYFLIYMIPIKNIPQSE